MARPVMIYACETTINIEKTMCTNGTTVIYFNRINNNIKNRKSPEEREIKNGMLKYREVF